MWRQPALLLALTLAGASAGAAPVPTPDGDAARHAVVGRWDITVRTPDGERPSWLEIRPSGTSSFVGQFVGVVGSARPISRVEIEGNTVRFAIPRQWEQGSGDVALEGRLEGDRLVGTLAFGDGKRHEFTARRAPALRHAAPAAWGEPLQLFNGRDLTGWRVLGESRWRVVDGVLRNERAGGNLVTERRFTDFRLHVEFRYPRGSNSGVYLRGRYEVQIQDSAGAEPQNDLLGAVYGFLAPTELPAGRPDEWQSFDITLVGRRITVAVNGRTVICDREIPGITGGALDSDEGAPGPLMLQGDHGTIEYRNIILTPAR